ncbi:hypothetical protein PGT21_020970 [Puccinia graminis f. sp. tritici]|uniref:Uncharacterized protein n=1 Tax=Puccinia graminis f. sp. tritici TaxID=56615 RepID=A0A5B0LWC7_PUCGR|nr:hypothetical protein PGT21_020970 [Puccinia graminis f. sp. tritici]
MYAYPIFLDSFTTRPPINLLIHSFLVSKQQAGIRLCSLSGTRPVLALHLDLIPSRLDRLVYPSRQLLDSSLVRQSSTNFSALHSSQNPRPTICLIAAVQQGLLRINTVLTPSKL